MSEYGEWILFGVGGPQYALRLFQEFRASSLVQGIPLDMSMDFHRYVCGPSTVKVKNKIVDAWSPLAMV